MRPAPTVPTPHPLRFPFHGPVVVGRMFRDSFHSYRDGGDGSPTWTPIAGTCVIEDEEYSMDRTAGGATEAEARHPTFLDELIEAEVRWFSTPGTDGAAIHLSRPDGTDLVEVVSWLDAGTVNVVDIPAGWVNVGSAPYTFSPDTFYRFTIEQIGTRTRVFVNGEFIVSGVTGQGNLSKGRIVVRSWDGHVHYRYVLVKAV